MNSAGLDNLVFIITERLYIDCQRHYQGINSTQRGGNKEGRKAGQAEEKEEKEHEEKVYETITLTTTKKWRETEMKEKEKIDAEKNQ